MVRPPNIIVILLIGIFLSSCKVGYIVLDVEQPPELQLEEEVYGLVLNNRITDTTLFKRKADRDVILTGTRENEVPSMAALKVISGLAESIYDQDDYTFLGATMMFPNRDSLGALPEPISEYSALNICKNNNADAMISLEGFKFESRMDHNSFIGKASNTPELVRDNTLVFSAETEEYHNVALKTDILLGWRIYSGLNGESLYEGWLLDSVIYEVQGKSREEAEKKLPSTSSVVEKAGFVAGRNILAKISPTYRTVERYYFKGGNPELRKAYQLVKFRRWEDAAEVWEPLVENPNDKFKAMALHNLALVAEKNGEMELALDCLHQALEYHLFQESIDYLKILQERLNP